ncbi:MAG: ketol-acid reductoisomerase, partial [Desulfocapsa sp.]|nr:ketol-acid reductoisomerase [Desulfocapsa sp.]
PLLADFMKTVNTDVIGKTIEPKDNGVNNVELIETNESIRYTGVEAVGEELRSYMSAMKQIL